MSENAQTEDKMTKEELAALINGREYREEMTAAEEKQAKAAGLVVVFGASDDLMEFRGAISDEVGAYQGADARLTNKGLLVNACENEDCPHFAKLKEAATRIVAVWDEGDIPWTYDTTIPHATFDILEQDEPYCRGIVFALADVP